MRKECLLISACLLGANCKYSGGSNRLPEEVLVALHERYFLLPVCPETAGGLGVPRTASERRGERVVSRTGADVTAAYRAGAQVACRLCERFRCRSALLKERSPSCGCGSIYDGSFTGTLIKGNGVAAEALLARGVAIFGESEIEKLL